MRGGAAHPVRFKYTKYGKVRWIGHRDVARALERSFRVVQLPLAFSEGFSPRPRVSFGLALSTGHESDGEYVDLVLAEPRHTEALLEPLTDALPHGMAVIGGAELVDRAPALQEAVTSVAWRVDVVRADGSVIDADELRAVIAAAEGRDALPTERRRKGRVVVEDVRPVIRHLAVLDERAPSGAPVVEMELHTQPRSAKPGEVLAAIGNLAEVRALRTHQWIERDGARLEPLDADTRPRVLEVRAS